MKIRENENILKEDYTKEEYIKFYKLDELPEVEDEAYDENEQYEEYEETEEEKEYSRKYSLNRAVELIRYINKNVTPNKLICPKGKEKEIDSLFFAFYDWVLFYGELDYDEYMSKMEDIFESSNTAQDKLDFIHKYYCKFQDEIEYETVESLIEKVTKNIENNKIGTLENFPEEYEKHLVK